MNDPRFSDNSIEKRGLLYLDKGRSIEQFS